MNAGVDTHQVPWQRGPGTSRPNGTPQSEEQETTSGSTGCTRVWMSLSSTPLVEIMWPREWRLPWIGVWLTPFVLLSIIAIHGLNGDREDTWSTGGASWGGKFLPIICLMHEFKVTGTIVEPMDRGSRSKVCTTTKNHFWLHCGPIKRLTEVTPW